MSLTTLDPGAVRLAFDRAAPRYDRHAVLQHEVEARLLERLEHLRAAPLCILDIGCGTGGASHQMQAQFPAAQVLALDWSEPMLQQMQVRTSAGRNPRPLCADMHDLPLPSRSVDLAFSNLAVQWSSDLSALFTGIRRVLKPGGMWLFSTFGPDTLMELRTAWAQADAQPHVNRFIDMHDIGDQLVATGFAEPVMDVDILTLEYRDVTTLMRELKAIGAHNAAKDRNPGLTGKGKFSRVLAAYEQFRREGIYPATYEVIYGVAFGPAEGQPFRSPEGEIATFSLDALRASRKGRNP